MKREGRPMQLRQLPETLLIQGRVPAHEKHCNVSRQTDLPSK